MRFLVTGGEGFIGSHICKIIPDAVAYDLKSGQDILDLGRLSPAVKDTDYLIHCAAKISVPESMSDPQSYYQTNVVGTQNLIAASEGASIQRIVFSSSAAVYGNKNHLAAEDSDLQPESNYAQNKIDGEKLLEQSGVPTVVLRYFNVYGPGQSSAYAGVITKFIQAALAGEDLIIFGDGSQVRDFIFVTDVAEANLLASKVDLPESKYLCLNIGSGIETKVVEVAEMVIELTKSKSKIIYQPARLGDIHYSCADNSQAKSCLGFNPKVSLREGLQQVINSLHK